MNGRMFYAVIPSGRRWHATVATLAGRPSEFLHALTRHRRRRLLEATVDRLAPPADPDEHLCCTDPAHARVSRPALAYVAGVPHPDRAVRHETRVRRSRCRALILRRDPGRRDGSFPADHLIRDLGPLRSGRTFRARRRRTRLPPTVGIPRPTRRPGTDTYIAASWSRAVRSRRVEQCPREAIA